jgi:predicted anti-sigma-YlaC factor YlaD
MSNNKYSKPKTHRCKEMASRLADYAAGELLAAEVQRLEAHLHTCPDCRQEYALTRALNEEARRWEDNCQAVMASIDWEKTARTISSQIAFKPTKTRKPRKSLVSWFHFDLPVISFNWQMALPAMVGIFLLGIGLGYLLFHVTPTVPLQTGSAGPAFSTAAAASLDRLENTLARKEVAGYFDQTQLVLTDLMKQCNTDGSFSLQNQVDMGRVRTLLGKGRYFKENLDDPRLLSSKQLLKKIDWLLYEILMTSIDEDTSCQKIEQLQDYIKQERLLFKIRLVGKELTLSEV